MGIWKKQDPPLLGLKLFYQNKNELPGTSMSCHDDSFHVSQGLLSL